MTLPHGYSDKSMGQNTNSVIEEPDKELKGHGRQLGSWDSSINVASKIKMAPFFLSC